MANLSLSDAKEMRSTVELLSEILKAVNPKHLWLKAVEDELIVELVGNCSSNQKKLMHLIDSTKDEEILGKGLELNDELQSLLAKHNSIAVGSPLPTEMPESVLWRRTPIAFTPVVANGLDEVEEEEDDDEFAQSTRRRSKHLPVSTEINSGLSNVPALPDPPAPVRTSTKEQDMVIDSLSIAIASNRSPPRTPGTPTSALNQNQLPVVSSDTDTEVHPHRS